MGEWVTKSPCEHGMGVKCFFYIVTYPYKYFFIFYEPATCNRLITIYRFLGSITAIIMRIVLISSFFFLINLVITQVAFAPDTTR